MTYTQTQLYKPIEVLSHFSNARVKVLKFKLDGRVYDVTRVANMWRIPDNEELFRTHFTVICDEEDIICELAYYHKSMKWEIIQRDNLTGGT
jgi:hypothetical protein